MMTTPRLVSLTALAASDVIGSSKAHPNIGFAVLTTTEVDAFFARALGDVRELAQHGLVQDERRVVVALEAALDRQLRLGVALLQQRRLDDDRVGEVGGADG